MIYNPCSVADRRTLAQAIQAMLEAAGFVKQQGTGEDVYAYNYPKIKNTQIVVYSSIENGVARGDGQDAIRVSALYTTQQGTKRGLFKDVRVNRTGEIEGIVERTKQRMRNAYAELNKKAVKGCCSKCGAPLFLSKNKNEVCAEACWTKK